MRPRAALCLLAVLATAASLCNRPLRGRRQQALSLRPSPVRRALTTEEAARLALGRAASARVVEDVWQLSPEEAARVAMAWPHALPSKPPRIQ